MAETDLNDPEFTPVRGELARVFLKHRASMGLGDTNDGWILAHVDDICLVLIELTKHAIDIDDRRWLRRHVWWRLLAHQLAMNCPPRRSTASRIATFLRRNQRGQHPRCAGDSSLA
jgi:hypothetical protein